MVNRAARSALVDAEAAAWVARLHGERTGSTEAALHEWLAEDPQHEAAFERATEIWTILPGAARAGKLESDRPRPTQRRAFHAPAFALAATVLLVLGFHTLWWSITSDGSYSTRPGEQKVATLEDGSRIALNTDTQVQLRFGDDRRQVELEHGEAMFEVARDAARPFIVQAGDTQVRAIGTVFIVRRTAGDVSVSLVEGKVAVSDTRDSAAGDRRTAAVLKPGERLTAPIEGPALIQSQPIEVATAWRRGQTVFQDTPLATAVSELNRYGGPTLVIDDPRVAALPVSGVFATNDSAEFAEAVAALHQLRVRKGDEEIRIER